MIGKEKSLDLLSGLIKKSPADQTSLVLVNTKRFTSRFANYAIHQSMQEQEVAIYIKVALGSKLGVASTGSIKKSNLKTALERALHIAKHSPKNPRLKSFPKPDEQTEIKTCHPKTTCFSASDKLGLLCKIFDMHKPSKTNPAGSFLTGEEEMAVVNSNGLIKYQPFSLAGLKLISAKDHASGFATWASRYIEDLQIEAVVEQAIRKCNLAKNPKPIAPGNYDCILEPAAVAEILQWLSYIGFGAKSFCERMSFLCGRIGDKIMSKDISIYDDGENAEGFANPFDYEGVNKKRVSLIEEGVARGPVYDSEYSYMNEGSSTGHALPPDETIGPLPSNLIMLNGESNLGDMITSLSKGILITRFHYVNGLLNTREAVMTGMTRDGTFLIQDGKIKHALKNLRFTQSILKAFSQIAAISKQRQLIGDLTQDEPPCLVPALLIKDFTFTS